jgi:hypothetical protein
LAGWQLTDCFQQPMRGLKAFADLMRTISLAVKRHFGHVACLSHVVGAMKCFGGYMAKIIEFYIPQSFRKVSRWFPPAERGKVLAFPLAVQKSA